MGRTCRTANGAIPGFFKGGVFFKVRNRCKQDAGEFFCVDHPLQPLDGGAELDAHADCLVCWLCPTHGIERPFRPNDTLSTRGFFRRLLGTMASGGSGGGRAAIGVFLVVVLVGLAAWHPYAIASTDIPLRYADQFEEPNRRQGTARPRRRRPVKVDPPAPLPGEDELEDDLAA
jgi:hypothetical protein